MPWLLVALALAQAPKVRVAVVDVSDADAVYEDVSRALADDVAEALTKAGFDAARIDESEMPDEGCRIGPCLARVARSSRAAILVALDAVEIDKKKVGVGLTALQGSNGAPLAGTRYQVLLGKKKVPKELSGFGAQLQAAWVKATTPPAPRDAGTAPPPPATPSGPAAPGASATPSASATPGSSARPGASATAGAPARSGARDGGTQP